MKIFLDTANIDEIRRFNDMGLLDGITTNPSLLFREGQDPDSVMKQITSMVDGDVSLEVVATKYAEMIQEGLKLYDTGDNVVVKVPMTPNGMRACRTLSSKDIPVNVTLVFSANQAILAAKSGAKYVSPFIGRLDDIGHNGMGLIRTILEIFRQYDFDTQVLVASIRHPLHVVEAAKLGAHVVTLPPKVLDQMLKHPLTDIGLDNFLSDWRLLQDSQK